MLILALDASTPVVTVALAREEDRGRIIVAEVSATGGASEFLLPAVHATLGLAGESLEADGRILVGVGPGTFTGIRIAASTARTLSLGTGAALAKNSTLAALAAPALATRPEVLAVLDAKRGQVFAQRFSGEVTGEVLCVGPAELAAVGSPLLVGDGAVRYREELSRLGDIPPDGSPVHRVTAAGHVLGADLNPVKPEEVLPLYIREPDAEVRRDLNPWSRR
ncbi:MAG: tRNA (adenosine(37)-N6)-threonylcarbamoyltransferase complex dimerization subunit type 1 TsaB [Rubrobacteraceae bacterium]